MSKRQFILGYEGETAIRFDLDLALKGRLLIQASSGAGKSETVKKICYATKNEIQSIIVDPEGEYSQLRAEMPFLLVGPGGEVPATLETAELIAHRLLETGVSAILDLYELGHAKRDWVRRFLVALDTAPKELRRETLLFLDEAHIFAPEMGNNMDPVGLSVADIASRGRKRGIGVVPVTQRLALLSNQIIGLCENMLVGRTGLLDAPRTAKLFAKTGNEGREFIKQIGRVQDGQFYAYGRAFGLLEPTLFQVERVPGQTLAKASKHGKRQAPPTPEELKVLLPRFEDLPKEVKGKVDAEAALRAELKKAQTRIAELERAGTTQQGMTEDERKVVAMLKEKLDALSEEIAATVEREAKWEAKLAEARKLVGLLASVLGEGGDDLGAVRERLQAMQSEAKQMLPKLERRFARQAPAPAPVPRPIAAADGEKPRSGALSGVDQRILGALAQFRAIGVDRPQKMHVCLFSGYSNMASKGFANAVSSLRTAGLIDYPDAGTVTLTAAGEAAAPVTEPIQGDEDLQGRIEAMLDGPQTKIFRIAVKAYPRALDKEFVMGEAGYGNAASKGFANSVSRLRSLGFIDYPSKGEIVATAQCFLPR